MQGWQYHCGQCIKKPACGNLRVLRGQSVWPCWFCGSENCFWIPLSRCLVVVADPKSSPGTQDRFHKVDLPTSGKSAPISWPMHPSVTNKMSLSSCIHGSASAGWSECFSASSKMGNFLPGHTTVF